MAKIEKSLESGPQLFFNFTWKYVPQLFLGAPQAEKVTLSPIIPNRKSCDTSQNFPRGHTKFLAWSECLGQLKNPSCAWGTVWRVADVVDSRVLKYPKCLYKYICSDLQIIVYHIPCGENLTWQYWLQLSSIAAPGPLCIIWTAKIKPKLKFYIGPQFRFKQRKYQVKWEIGFCT